MNTLRQWALLFMTAAFLVGFSPFNRDADQARDQLTAAQALIETGQIDQAISTLRSLRLQYQDTEAGYEGTALLGVLLLERGDAEGALTAARGVLGGDHPPQNAINTAHLVAGLSLFDLGRFAEAKPHLAPLDGTITSPGDLRHLAAAMADICAQEGDALAEVRWQIQRLAVSPPSEQEAIKARVQVLVVEHLEPNELSALASEVGKYYPADYIVYAQMRAAFRSADFTTAHELAAHFLSTWPEHPEAEVVSLVQQRAARQDAMVPTRIGVILPLSGRFSAPGEAVKKGMELAISRLEHPQWAGTPVKLIFRDSAGEEGKALEAVKDLVLNEQVSAIIGPLTSQEAQGPAELAQDLEIPLITLTQREGIPAVGDYIFRNFPTLDRQFGSLARFAAEEMGIERLGILYPENRYGTWMAGLMWDDAIDLGMEVTAIEPYQTGEDDYTPVAQKLAGKFYIDPRSDELRSLKWARKNDDNPSNDNDPVELPAIVDFDALFIADHYRAAALLAPALAYVEIPVGRFTVDKRKPIPLLGGNTWSNKDLARIGGEYVIGATFVADFFPGASVPQTREFVTAYRRAHGAAPETFAAHGYDSVAILLHVLHDSEPTSRADVRDRLHALTDYPGATGTLSFSEDGDLDRDPFILRINRRRNIVQVYPPLETEGKKPN